MKQFSKYIIIILCLVYAFLPLDTSAQDNLRPQQGPIDNQSAQNIADDNRGFNWWWLLLPIVLLPFALLFWPKEREEEGYSKDIAYHDIEEDDYEEETSLDKPTLNKQKEEKSL